MPHFYKKSLLWLLLTSLGGLSQDIDIQSQSSLGGANSEYLFDAIPTPDGGFIIAGSTNSNQTGNLTQNNNGDLDYWVCKMDGNNNLLWQKSYGGSKLDLLQSVKATSDGGYILAGISSSDSSGSKLAVSQGSTDYWIVKINAAGGEQWQTTIGGTGLEKLNQITQTAEGGYIIAGSSSSKKSVAGENGEVPLNQKTESCRGGLDFWVVKLKTNGEVDWQKTIGGQFADELKVIQPLPNNEYLLGGYSNSPISGDKTSNNIGLGDYWIVKINSAGEIIWQQTLGGNTDDVLVSLITTQDGGFIIGGNSGATPSNVSGRQTMLGNKSKSNSKGTDFWVIKLDDQGAADWQETYNFGNHDALTSITEDTNGNILIGGYAQSEASSTSASGKGAIGKLIKPTDKEGINDYIALKIDKKGKQLWTQAIGSRGDEVLKKLLPTLDGGFLLAGTSNGGKSRDKNAKVGGSDFWVVKLKNTNKEEIEAAMTAFPNPAVNETKVAVTYNYDYGAATLYDLNGRQLQTIELKGEKQIPFNLNGLPQGMYLINVKTNNGTNAVKVIKK